MKALITGITGFVGSHLAEYLLSKNYEVYGTYRWRSRMENIIHIKEKLKLYECDLKDATAVYNLIKEIKPDMIFHLAAQSYVPMSWACPSETIITNVISQINILEAVKNLKMDTLIHIAGSSEEYGLVYENEIPIKETNPLRPLSPYGVSKVAQDLLGYQYYKSYNLKIIRTRAFNHEGPRRGEVFVTSNFAKQIAEIEKGKREPIIYVGNLQAVRDFTDVRDVVRGYYLVLTRGRVGEVYNIASGKGYKIKEILDFYLEKSKVKVEVKIDERRLRPSDVELLIGDATKIKEECGWQPEIPIEKTLEDLLNYWRERV
ncbi:MAG: GDP-mannose 4,6-dehydratase [candidate division WOR-3 bacterium]|nr:GDP-mannose 4,6-dehydratase [candidate division WOR-3 bacterium]MCX7837128.1 GDP-mannose 4,6-dehydratase [candidate division WOR-3 bacterium]MDW8113663.1 GDP-mannose 4,6-dehydratase [candidate division WOR-3 bacterium]